VLQICGDGRDCLFPIDARFPARQQCGIKEDGISAGTGLKGHLIEHPRAVLELEPKPVQQDNQRSGRQDDFARTGDIRPEQISKMMAERDVL
jgi:hypothetical protein